MSECAQSCSAQTPCEGVDLPSCKSEAAPAGSRSPVGQGFENLSLSTPACTKQSCVGWAPQDTSDIDHIVPNVIFSLLIAAASLVALGGLITALQPYFLVGAVCTAAPPALPSTTGRGRERERETQVLRLAAAAQGCSPYEGA